MQISKTADELLQQMPTFKVCLAIGGTNRSAQKANILAGCWRGEKEFGPEKGSLDHKHTTQVALQQADSTGPEAPFVQNFVGKSVASNLAPGS